MKPSKYDDLQDPPVHQEVGGEQTGSAYNPDGTAYNYAGLAKPGAPRTSDDSGERLVLRNDEKIRFVIPASQHPEHYLKIGTPIVITALHGMGRATAVTVAMDQELEDGSVAGWITGVSGQKAEEVVVRAMLTNANGTAREVRLIPQYKKDAPAVKRLIAIAKHLPGVAS